MVYICTGCGEENAFGQISHYKKWVEIEETIDKHGEHIDSGEEYVKDTEYDGSDDMYCFSCNDSEYLKDVDASEIPRIRWEHTDKDGVWHEEVLDEKERCKKLKAATLTEAL